MDCSAQTFCKANQFAQPLDLCFKAIVATPATHPLGNLPHHHVKIASAATHCHSAANSMAHKLSHFTGLQSLTVSSRTVAFQPVAFQPNLHHSPAQQWDLEPAVSFLILDLEVAAREILALWQHPRHCKPETIVSTFEVARMRNMPSVFILIPMALPKKRPVIQIAGRFFVPIHRPIAPRTDPNELLTNFPQCPSQLRLDNSTATQSSWLRRLLAALHLPRCGACQKPIRREPSATSWF